MAEYQGEFPLALDLSCRADHVGSSQKKHLVALAHFAHLKTLECPRWLEEPDQDLVEEEELAMEVALALPTIRLFAVVGQQSEEQWRRIGRDATGIQVDRVTFYCTNLDRL